MRPLLFVFFLLPSLLMAADTPQGGTVIVTYQINDKNGERIDRIRFWLKNENGERTLYPKETGSTASQESNKRAVSIKDLEPGNYTLAFLIPNLDNRFEPIPETTLTVVKGEKTEINQEITIRKRAVIAQSAADQPENEDPTDDQEETDISYGKLIVSFKLKEDPLLADQIHFRLISEGREATTHPIQGEDIEVSLHDGKMVMLQQLPTGKYQIEFFMNGQKEFLANRSIEIVAGRTKSVHQPLELHPVNQGTAPSLTLKANVPTATFTLVHTKTGQVFTGKGHETTFQNIPSGGYVLQPKTSDPFFIPPKEETIAIKAGESANKELSYKALGKLYISTNIAQTMAHITPLETSHPPFKKEILNKEGNLYLPAGRYRVTFSQERGLKTPDPVDINVTPLQTERISAYFL